MTNVSDQSKPSVMRAWVLSVFGLLGFHYFKVGRIKHGFFRLIFGLLVGGLIITCFTDPEMRKVEIIMPSIIVAFIPSVVDLVKIQLGLFRDNVGNKVRGK